MMFTTDEFIRRFKDFQTYDYGNSYYNFWKYKVKVESGEGHILDEANLQYTFSKLGPILRAWQTYRPFDSNICLKRLYDSLKEISSEYDLVRKKSLLEFDKIPRNALESIWHKLGRVKEKDGSENRFSKYYVMATTKQLMFLWGQTLAFDTLIRKMMPSSKYAYIRAQGKENRWAFSMWYNVMSEFQERVLEMPDFIELGYKISSDEFGSDKIVPFGQFVDLYYWIGAKKRKRKTV